MGRGFNSQSIYKDQNKPKVCCIHRCWWRWYPLSSAIHWSQSFGSNSRNHKLCCTMHAFELRLNDMQEIHLWPPLQKRPVSWLLLTILQSKFIKCKSFDMMQGVTEAVQLLNYVARHHRHHSTWRPRGRQTQDICVGNVPGHRPRHHTQKGAQRGSSQHLL